MTNSQWFTLTLTQREGYNHAILWLVSLQIATGEAVKEARACWLKPMKKA